MATHTVVGQSYGQGIGIGARVSIRGHKGTRLGVRHVSNTAVTMYANERQNGYVHPWKKPSCFSARKRLTENGARMHTHTETSPSSSSSITAFQLNGDLPSHHPSFLLCSNNSGWAWK